MAHTISWQQLYFDLYRQVYGDTATTAEITRDARERRRTIRANIARLRDQEDRTNLVELEESSASAIKWFIHLERVAGEGVKVRTAAGFPVMSARSMGGQLQAQVSTGFWIDCQRIYISMPDDYYRLLKHNYPYLEQYCPTCGHDVHALYSPDGGLLCPDCATTISEIRSPDPQRIPF